MTGHSISKANKVMSRVLVGQMCGRTRSSRSVSEICDESGVIHIVPKTSCLRVKRTVLSDMVMRMHSEHYQSLARSRLPPPINTP